MCKTEHSEYIQCGIKSTMSRVINKNKFFEHKLKNECSQTCMCCNCSEDEGLGLLWDIVKSSGDHCV